jgi:hypothetical protein
MMSIAAAQEPPVGSPARNPRWGTVNPQQLNVAAIGFTPQGNGTWVHNADTGWSYRSGGTSSGMCTNIHLPTGALLEFVTTWTNDTDAATNVVYVLYSVDLTTNIGQTPFSFSTTGTPGIERYART